MEVNDTDDDAIDLDAVDEDEGNSLPLLPDGEEGEKELVIHVPEETAKTAEIGALTVLTAIIVIASVIALILFVLDRRRRRKVLEVVDKLEKTEEGGSAPSEGDSAPRGGYSFDTNDTATTVTTEQSDLNTLSPETPLLQDNSNNNRRRDRNANASLDRRKRRCCMCFCCPPENEPSLEDLWMQKKAQQQINANNARTGSARKSLKLMEEGMTHMEGFQNFLNRTKSSSVDKTTRHKPNLDRRHRSERLHSAQRSASYPQRSPPPKASRRKSYSNTNDSCRNRASASRGERFRSHSHSLANRSHSHPCRHNQNGHRSIGPTPHRSTRTRSLDQRYRSQSQHRGDARSKSLDQNHSGRNKSSDRHHSGRAVSPERRHGERRSSLGRQLAEHPCSLRSKSGERNNESVEKRPQSSRPRSIGRQRSESNEHHRGQRKMNDERQRGSSSKRLCSGKFQSAQDKRVVPSDRHSGRNRSQNQSSHRHSRQPTSPHHHHHNHNHNHSHRHNESDSPSGSPERKSRRRDRCHDSPSQNTSMSYRTSHTSNNPKKSCGSCRNRGPSARQYVGGRDRCKENDRHFDSRSAGSYSNSRQNYPEYPQSRQHGSHGQVKPSARYENRNQSATQPFAHSTPNIAAQNKFGTAGLVQGNLGASGRHQYTPGASRLNQQNTSAYHVGHRNSYDPGIAQDSMQASGVGRNHTYGPGVVQNNHHTAGVGHDNPYTGVPQEKSYASGMSQTHHQSSKSGQNAAQSSWVNSARSTDIGQYDPRVNQNNPNASSVAENMRNASNVGQNNPYISGVSQVQAQRTIPSTISQRPNPQRHYEGQYFNSQEQGSQRSYENSRGHNPQRDHPAQYATQYPAKEHPHYQYRNPHLNVSQNYNCEESDCQSGDTHSASDETRKTVSPAVGKAEREMSEGHNDEHSDTVASTSRAKLSCSRKKRFFRPCKRSPTPRFMLKHKHKRACTSKGLAGRFQGTDTSSDDSLRGKDDTVSLAQKLFGLKLKSRKRPKRSRSFLSRKKPRKVELRPLLGSPGFSDSEDTTHETSNETEQMDSEFEVSDILPADSGYSAPTVQVDSAYDVSASLPSETRRSGLVSSDPSPAVLERRSGSVWHGSVVFPSWKEETVSVRRRKNRDRGKNIVFPNRPVEALQEPPHLLLMPDSLDAFTETELKSNSRTLSIRMDERKHKKRLQQDGSETPTSYSEGMVCVDLNSADLRALASGDDKEFRILATQRWCEQQSMAALMSPPLSQAEEESVATDTPREQRSDLSVTVSSRTTDVFAHQTGSSVQDRVSYGEELSHRVNTANAADVSFQGSLPTAHTESISQGYFPNENSSVNSTRSPSENDFAQYFDNERNKLLPVAHFVSDVDYMDFRASSNNSRAASDGESELCDNSTPVPSQSSHSECSDLFDEFAQQRLNQYEQSRDLFSADTAETSTVNILESPECIVDRDSLEHGQRLVNAPNEFVDAESPDTSLEEAQVLTEEIRHQNISAGTSYHSLQKEIDQDSCSLNTSRKCPFPSESRTFEAFQPSEERQSSHLSLSVIPPCAFQKKT